MTVRRIEAGLLAVTVLCSFAAVWRLRGISRSSAIVAPAVAPLTQSSVTFSAALLGEAALAATERNPFRLSRAPSEVAFVPRRLAMAAPPPAPAGFRGALVLKGIVGGPPWQAVIDGLPGQPAGTVVSAGSTFEKLVVRSVSRDSVVIQAPDTVWRLTLIKRNQ